MGMLIARRLAFMVFVLWGITLVTFFLSRVVPGDPARLLAGPQASPAEVAHLARIYGLDDPLIVQTGTTCATSCTATSGSPSLPAGTCAPTSRPGKAGRGRRGRAPAARVPPGRAAARLRGGSASCSRWSGCRRCTPGGTRMSCPAGSASG